MKKANTTAARGHYRTGCRKCRAEAEAGKGRCGYCNISFVVKREVTTATAAIQ